MNHSPRQRFSTLRKTMSRIRGLQIFAPRTPETPSQWATHLPPSIQMELDFGAKKSESYAEVLNCTRISNPHIRLDR